MHSHYRNQSSSTAIYTTCSDAIVEGFSYTSALEASLVNMHMVQSPLSGNLVQSPMYGIHLLCVKCESLLPEMQCMGWDTHFSHTQKPPEEPYMTSASSAQIGDNSSLNSSNQVRQCLLP